MRSATHPAHGHPNIAETLLIPSASNDDSIDHGTPWMPGVNLPRYQWGEAGAHDDRQTGGHSDDWRHRPHSSVAPRAAQDFSLSRRPDHSAGLRLPLRGPDRYSDHLFSQEQAALEVA